MDLTEENLERPETRYDDDDDDRRYGMDDGCQSKILCEWHLSQCFVVTKIKMDYDSLKYFSQSKMDNDSFIFH